MDTDKINSYLEREFNCTQTVFSYFASEMDMDEETAMKIATPFEMGMYKADTCGALTGAYMALGLKYGTLNFEDRMKLKKLTEELTERFNEKMKSTKCIDLIGFNINNDMQRALDEGKLETVCGACIPHAIEITEDIIQKNGDRL